MKIETDYWRKPGPTNKFDWSAVYDNYDGAEDSHCPIGYGATEQEAINDLLEIAPPCKNESPYVRTDGGCLKCDADQGETCR